MKRRRNNPYLVSNGAILFVFAISLGSLAFFLWQSHAIRQAEHWPTTPAVVTESVDASSTNLVETDNGTRPVKRDDATFAFTYTVAGQQYASRHFYLLGKPPADFIVSHYPRGLHFDARYNPEAPAMAIVEPGRVNVGAPFLSLLSGAIGVAFMINNVLASRGIPFGTGGPRSVYN